ncbi:MAG: hypothetical protein ACRDBG_26470, partial [Waterburya sp.]
MSDIPKFEETEEIVPKFDETEEVRVNQEQSKESKPGILSKHWDAFKGAVTSGEVNPMTIAADYTERMVNTVDKRDLDPKTYLTAAQQGLSGGFSDEASGAILGGIDTVTGSSYEVPGESKLDRYKRLYGEYRNAERNRLAKIEAENPEAYMVGDVAGSMLLPYGKIAGAAAKVAPASKLAQGAMTAGVTGFAEGVGRSEGETTEDIISDGTKGAAL